MRKFYRILTESGEYDFKTNIQDRSEARMAFAKLYEKKTGRRPKFAEIINEGLLDFWKKKKKTDNKFKSKEEINKQIKSENKSVNKSGPKLFDDLKKIRQNVTEILKKYGDLFNSNKDFKNIKEHIQYVSKYIKYAYAGLESAIHNKNINDTDSINSVPAAVVKVRKLLGGENYENSNLSEDEMKTAFRMLTKVAKDRRNDEWQIYYDFLAQKLGKDTQPKTPSSGIKIKRKKAQKTPTKSKLESESEEIPVKKKGKKCGSKAFVANSTQWF